MTASLAVSLVAAASARAADAIEDGEVWSMLFASGPIHGRLLGSIDLQGRFDDDVADAQQTIARAALGARFGAAVDLYAGYARIDLLRAGRPDLGENRAWQQLGLPVADLFGGVLGSRTRLEQRFLDSGDDVGWRVRQLLRFGRRLDGVPISLVVFDEVFFALNDTDWGARAGFDQNRFFAGPAWHVAPSARIELGYLNQWIRRSGSPDRVNHVLSLGFLVAR